MAEQVTGHAHAIPMNDLASVTVPDPLSPSNPQIAAFQDFNGSTISLNGVNESLTGGHHAFSHEHPWFCHRQRPTGVNASTDFSTVDIVAVPAVGGYPMLTWYMSPKSAHLTHVRSAESVNEISSPNMIEGVLAAAAISATAPAVPSYQPGSPWILKDLPEELKTARILVYSHGKPAERSTIDSLAINLLDKILDERKSEDEKKRPLFFLCHSTGGLVVKAALIKARGDQRYDVVGDNCYGVAFFATPHQGSSYLSSPIYSDTIQRAMGLQWPMPTSLQKQLKIKSEVLVQMARDWMPVAAELKLWTFYETIDTDLTDGNANENERVSFQAPITSIKSAILDLHHEVDRPVLADHANCAAFGPENEYTKRSFIRKLHAAADQAQKLSLLPHKNNVLDNLDKKIDVEVHGFYENTDQKVSDKHPKKPIRLWSTINSFDKFMRDGPAKSLQDRLQEKTIPPTRTQMMAVSSRRTSFRQPEPMTNAAGSQNAKPEQRLTAKQSGGPKVRPLQGILSKNKGSPGSAASTEKRKRRFSLPTPFSPSATRVPLPAVAGSLGDQGLQSRESVPAMPSVFISEHEDETELALTPSISNPSEREPTMAADSSAPESRRQLRSYPVSEEQNTGGPSSHSPSPQRARRLSPLIVPSQSNLSPSLLSPIDSQQSDDSGAESNYSSGGEAPTAGPPRRPDPESQKFVWIHLAYNNPKWVSDIFSAISTEKRKPLHDTLLSDTIWCKRHVRGRNTHYHACFVKPGCILIQPELKPPSDPPTPSPEAPVKDDIMMSLYLPYLHWDTYRRMVKRREIVKSRLTQGRARPTPESIGTMDLELIVAWKYLGYDPPFHTRRTLDQFGYPNLTDTRARDDDQMLYKMTKHPPKEKEEKQTQDGNKKNAPGDAAQEKGDDPNLSPKKDFYKTLKDGKVLMVDQVWLWIVDNSTVVTFFAKRQAISLEGKLYQQADLRNSIYNEVNADLSRRCESSLDLAALVALHSVTLLFERASHRDLEIFRIFEAAISILVEKLTTSFKYFRAKGFQAVADNDDSDDDAEAIRQHHKEEGKKFQTQVQQNVSALLELRDINDELLTLKKLFGEQQEAIDKMLLNYERCGYGTINGIGFLHEAQMKLKDYLHRIKEMMESAERTRGDFEKLLDLVQRQANVDEARRARWQVDLQQKQSRAIFIFTVFTIFFLPLSFFTGVFGMNVSQWSGPGGQLVDLQTVGKISLPVSFAIFGGALTLALSTPVWRFVKYAVTFPFRPLETIEYDSSSDETHSKSGTQTRKAKRQVRKFKKANRNLEDYRERDFWQVNRENIEDKYVVPEHNMQPEEEADGKAGSWRRSSRKSSSGSKRRRNQAAADQTATASV